MSDMTVHRDLGALEVRGEARKVRGGAVAPEGTRTGEPGFEAESAPQEGEEHASARLVAADVRGGRE